MTNKIKTASLGFSRIGGKRELKFALEKFWSGEVGFSDVEKVAKEIRLTNWKTQASLDYIPSGDFSFYDHILDISVTFNNTPAKFDVISDDVTKYFALCRGYQKDGHDLHACDMSKLFNTNYHYIVPELHNNKKLSYNANNKFVSHFVEAKNLGFTTRPVIMGLVSYLLLSKEKTAKREEIFPQLLKCYVELLADLKKNGCTDVQIDEPFLATELDSKWHKVYKEVFAEFAKIGLNIHLATYFDELGENTELAFSLPVKSVHIDVSEFDLPNLPKTDKIISLGLVNGRNIWRNDFERSIKIIEQLKDREVIIATSCSLLHVPVSLKHETKLPSEIKQTMSYAEEKIDELIEIRDITSGTKKLEQNSGTVRPKNESVWKRLNALSGDFKRKSEFKIRKEKQKILGLPLFPTTTIGSFPQESDIRKNRSDFKKGLKTEEEYNNFCRQKIAECVKIQEDLDIDVLVHGECERNDMVEYFGENLDGFCFTENGWVQSYGSRCVKPPVIYGDVSRPKAMTVEWSKYAQSCTKRIMKGMLTGPITILKWSFVRDDISLEQTCKQIALALQDEVKDLETAGIKIIQIDEPAIREGLPIRKSKWDSYLKWAVDAFRVSCQTVNDETQIHTHMCYSEFNDIMPHILALDADCLSIECSRSDLDVLRVLKDNGYTNDIGPGVWDIHSPRVPSEQEMSDIMKECLKILPKDQLWINPDCGLKTRKWPETLASLKNMVSVAHKIRN